MADEAFVFPTSFAQQRLWFLSQLMPGNAFYNLHAAIPIAGPLDRSALRLALQQIVMRHETLRTRFVTIDDEPMQAISPDMEIPLPEADLRSLPVSARRDEALRLATEESRLPFDLSVGPLIRARLLRLDDDEHVLFVTLHHIIADGWSMGVFFQELHELYGAFATGRPSSLPELPIQYADFAVWQREWLSGELLEEQLAYWRERLADLPTLNLPTDHRRPPIASFRGDAHEFELPRNLVRSLQTLSRAHGATLFMVLLAAFKVLLSRYAGQEAIVVGAPIANRNRAEIEPLIGFFVNTLVLYTDLSGDPPFREVLERVREVTLGGYAHQDLPFERLVEELQPDRDLSRNPLFQVTFQLHNAPPVTDLAARGGGGGGRLDVRRGTANFDVAFDLWEHDGRLIGRVDYSTDLFEAVTIRRMAEHYRVLLESILSHPEARVSELPILAEVERKRLLDEWSSAASVYPRDRCIHSIFAEQVARSPAATAVVAPDESLTYAELEVRANRVARWLELRGVGPDIVVGISTDRSAKLIVGLLGILKSGGAYAALDPAYPNPRLGMILEESGIGIVITESGYAARFGQLGCEVLVLDDRGEALSCLAGSPPDGGATADSLAYVAYTSGSTGRPKGVCIRHRGVVRLVRGQRYVELSEREVILHFSPVSFDASTFEIWGCLLNGGRLIVAPPGPISLEELARTLTRHHVSTAWFTAGLFHQMIDEQLPSLLGVRQILAGGDVLSPAHLRRLLEAPGERRVINGYGPTENTTFTCCHVMKALEDVGEPVPIGRPIANTRVYVLDGHGNPVPVGIPGELHAGGDGLARGYLNDPESTAERFIPNPFEPGDVLYRTGDRVRFRSDGLLEFIGRLDRQVKIRGFRVEPAEVEAVLGRHSEVGGAAVVPVPAEGGDRRLVAYFAPRGERIPTREELRTFLLEHLPAFLIPSDFVAIERIPLTPNGKVDAASLPEAACLPLEPTDRFVAPRNEVEEALAGMWRQLLRRDRVGVHDDFFADLGGHSLLATQLISRVREAFGIELPLRSLFEGPTVAGLAAAVEGAILDELETDEEELADRDGAWGGELDEALPIERYHGP